MTHASSRPRAIKRPASGTPGRPPTHGASRAHRPGLVGAILAGWPPHRDRLQRSPRAPLGRRTGAEVARLEGLAENVSSADFSPDGRRVVLSVDDRTARIRIWRAIGRSRAQRAPGPHSVRVLRSRWAAHRHRLRRYHSAHLGRSYAADCDADSWAAAAEFDPLRVRSVPHLDCRSRRCAPLCARTFGLRRARRGALRSGSACSRHGGEPDRLGARHRRLRRAPGGERSTASTTNTGARWRPAIRRRQHEPSSSRHSRAAIAPPARSARLLTRPPASAADGLAPYRCSSVPGTRVRPWRPSAGSLTNAVCAAYWPSSGAGLELVSTRRRRCRAQCAVARDGHSERQAAQTAGGAIEGRRPSTRFLEFDAVGRRAGAARGLAR